LSKVTDRGAQAVSCGGARCASRELDRGAQANSRGAAQVSGRGSQAVARGAAALSQQKKNNTADVQRNRTSIIGFICTMDR
jgi:hypothetical protein